MRRRWGRQRLSGASRSLALLCGRLVAAASAVRSIALVCGRLVATALRSGQLRVSRGLRIDGMEKPRPLVCCAWVYVFSLIRASRRNRMHDVDDVWERFMCVSGIGPDCAWRHRCACPEHSAF